MDTPDPITVEAYQKLMDRYSENGGVIDLGQPHNIDHMCALLAWVAQTARSPLVAAMKETINRAVDRASTDPWVVQPLLDALPPSEDIVVDAMHERLQTVFPFLTITRDSVAEFVANLRKTDPKFAKAKDECGS